MTHTVQMNLMALLPIFKILFQIQKNNEDDSYRNLISRSEMLAEGHRLKIVKAHSIIKAYK